MTLAPWKKSYDQPRQLIKKQKKKKKKERKKEKERSCMMQWQSHMPQLRPKARGSA